MSPSAAIRITDHAAGGVSDYVRVRIARVERLSV